MGYILGTDEAGYGPNLGPLLIGGSLWQVPGDPRKCDLHSLLSSGLAASLAELDKDDARVVLADSKALYQPQRGLALLEQHLLAALAQVHPLPVRWREAWSTLCPAALEELDDVCYQGYDGALPLAAEGERIYRSIERLRSACEDADVRLMGLSAKAVFPGRFNQLTTDYGNKAETLSRETLRLIGDLLATLPDDDQPVLILCDRHGGRKHYAAMLQAQFPEQLIEVRRESPEVSEYRWPLAGRRLEMRFATKCERFAPAALASMAAKYLRELAMQAFNAFWCQRVTDLKPTAGYPADAKRFKAAISACQRELGIADHGLWRVK